MSMRSEHVDQMSIGEFARRSRLSAKALRLHDELGLLPPARVDEDSGYRFYEPGQLKQARLIAALRQLQVPLAEINAILPLAPGQAAERLRELWAVTEADHSSRRALATYLIDELSGKGSVVYEVGTREMPERSLLCMKRNVARVDRAWAFGKEFIALLRHYQLPQIPGRAGAFFCIYWGEVSEESDGPMEWCRPVPAGDAEALAARCPELTLRAEPAHQEAFVTIGDGRAVVAYVERPAAGHAPGRSGRADHVSAQRSGSGHLPRLRGPVQRSAVLTVLHS
jgi:DNA-binding transcriptional MerR regulator